MPTSRFDHQRLPELSQHQWHELQDFFGEPRETVMIHELANDTTLTKAQAIALLDCLALDETVTNWVLLYHDCADAETYAHARPAGQGPFTFPLRCPHCDQQIDPHSVSYGMLAQVKTTLPRFEDDQG